jgi:hypothetical protein
MQHLAISRAELLSAVRAGLIQLPQPTPYVSPEDRRKAASRKAIATRWRDHKPATP